jgi:hypothetical protein
VSSDYLRNNIDKNEERIKCKSHIKIFMFAKSSLKTLCAIFQKPGWQVSVDTVKQTNNNKNKTNYNMRTLVVFSLKGVICYVNLK